MAWWGQWPWFGGTSSRRIVVDQEPGIYDLSLELLGHRLSASSITLLVNGVEASVASAEFDPGGTHRHWSRETVTFDDIALRQGDVIEFRIDAESGPAPLIREIQYDLEELTSGPVLGDELIVNGGFEDHDPLTHVTRNGSWDILENGQVAGWFAETVSETLTLDFEGLTAGDRVGDHYADQGVHIWAEARRDGDNDRNDDMIFDAAAPTGGDGDLGQQADQGNLLIISEDSDSTDPDDAAAGGTIHVRFDDPKHVASFKIIDNEEAGGVVRLYDSRNNLIDKVWLPTTDDGGIATVALNQDAVSKMVIRLKGSGAIDDIVLGSTVDGAIEIQEGRVWGAPKNPRDNAVLELDSTENARISQTVLAPEAGEYRLTFDYAARGFGPTHREETAGLLVLVNGAEVLAESTGRHGYQPYAVIVSLTAGANTISFQGTGASDGIGALIDNVSLRQILTPGDNQPPVARNDSFAAAEDTLLSGNVLADNGQGPDNDPDGDGLTVSLVADAVNGDLVLNGDGTFTYTPDADFFGSDSFTYRATDGAADSNVATVQITVEPVNDDPELSGPVTATVGEDEPVFSVDLLQGASDPDQGDLLSVSGLTLVAGDDRGINVTGNSLAVDPEAYTALAVGETAVISYAYNVTDGQGGSVPQTATVTIVGANDSPTVSSAITVAASEDDPTFSVGLLQGAVDPDTSDSLSIANLIVTGGDDSGVSASGTDLDIDPGAYGSLKAGEAAVVSLSFDIVDGNGGVVGQTATITINGADDPPPAPTLSLALSDQVDAGTTQAGIVSLVGSTGANLTVELLDEDGATVLAAVQSNNIGEFRFSGIALDPGANDLSARATDPATGLSATSQEIEIVRDAPPVGAQPNAAVFWNEIALEAIADSATTPDMASRALAMESHAVFNVLAAVNGTNGFLFNTDASAGVSASAAVSYAAHQVLSYLFPGQSDVLDQALADSLAGIVDGLAAAAVLGEAIASQVIALRDGDGWNDLSPDTGSTAPGAWRPTGPDFNEGLNPHWADLDPFLLRDGDQFRPDAPPSLLDDTITNDAYANDLERVRALGDADSTARTADQTEIARYWADGTGTATPPGHWNRIASSASEAEGLGLSQTAELLLQLNLSLADAGIAAWDTKYAYDLWRPITVLSEGAEIDGTTIDADPSFAPLLLTPNHPDYVSGHSTYSGAAATVLTRFFGDDYAFTSDSETVSGVLTRSFDSFWEAAQEAGESRIFGGIHFDFSNQTGLALGESVAQWVLQSFDPLNDVIAPKVTLAVDNGFATDLDPTLDGFLTDNLSGAVRLRASVDGGDYEDVTVAPDGSFSFQPGIATDGSADGRHTVKFAAQDASGNTTIKTIEFTVATQAGDILLDAGSISDAMPDLSDGVVLSGSVDFADANTLAGLNYRFDGGPAIPVPFSEDGSFNVELDISDLAIGGHTLVIEATDAAGNITTETIDTSLATLPAFVITKITPADFEGDVGTTFRPQIEFSRAVDLSTLTDEAIFATDSTGAKLAARIVPLSGGDGAWLFFDDPLPGASAITLNVVGDLLLAADGAALDADGDGTAGGTRQLAFTTTSDAPVPGTTLTGVILDPGADLLPMTPDDFAVSPNGATDWDGHAYSNPLEGVKVFVLGHEDEAVLTDANGRFTLTDLPAGHLKIAVDGRTAVNAPSDTFFPEMVMDVLVRPGVENTIMAGMGSPEAQIAHIGNDAVYLPRVPSSSLMPVSDTDATVIQPVSAEGSSLTADQLDLLTLTVQPNSLIDAEGNVVANAEIGISLVPPPLVTNMLPDDVPAPPLFITIQAPGGAVFTEEAVLTLPNVFGAAAGEVIEIFSFDHTTGLYVVNGTGTVSADGLSVTTDPGSGIDQPGWHGGPPPVARMSLDLRIPCPPSPDAPHQNVTTTDILDAYGDMRTNGAIVQNSIEAMTGRVDAPVRAPGALGVADTVNTLRQDDARIQSTMDMMAEAYYAGEGGAIGGPVDAAWWGIAGLQLAGDVAGTAVHTFSGIVTNIPFFEGTGLERTGQILNTAVDGARAYETVARGDNLLQSTINLRDKAIADAQAAMDNGLGGKVPEAERGRFQEVIDKANDLSVEIADTQDKFQRVLPHLEIIIERGEELRDFFDDFDIGEELGGKDPLDIIGPQSSQAESPFLDAMRDFVDASIEAAQVGAVVDEINDILDSINDMMDVYDRNFGEDFDSALAADVLGTSNSLTYEFLYGPRFYGVITNTQTGESEYFTFDPATTYNRVVDPNSSYDIVVFDPVSGQVTTSSFTSSGLGGSVALEPLLRDDMGSVGAGGLTELGAKAVGANTAVADSLLPGSGITDKQALISGLAGSPQLTNVNGVTGVAEMAGSAEAVALGNTTGNGGGLLAFVATGDAGLAAVDVADPAIPIVLGQIDLPGFASDVAINMSLQMAAVALGDGGLAIVDFSSGTSLDLAYTLSDLQSTEVTIIDDRVYVGKEGRIFQVDLASGTELGSIGLGVGPTQSITAFAVDGTTLYVLGDNGTMHVVETANDTLDVVGTIDLSGEYSGAFGTSLFVADGVAWVGAGVETGGEGGLITVDVSDPTAPTLISGIDENDLAGGIVQLNGSGIGVGIQQINITSSVPFVNRNSLDLFSADDATDTGARLSSFDLNGALKDVALANGMAFVASGDNGLQIVRYLGIDVQGQAPSLTVTDIPEDVDSGTAGLQLFEGQAIEFGVDVTDDVQVRSVDLLVNDSVFLSQVSFPWDLKLQLPSIADNGGDQLQVRLRATDTGGNVTLSAAIAIQLVADTTPFTIVDITPDDGASLSVVRSMTVRFSKPVDDATVTPENFRLTDANGGAIVATAVQVRNGGTEVQLSFDVQDLQSGNYTLSIDGADVTDIGGTALGAGPITSSFEIVTIGGQTWISPVDGTWNDPLNWATGEVPDENDDVILPLDAGVTATINDDAGSVRSVDVSGDGTLLIQTSLVAQVALETGALTNSGNVSVAFGQFIIDGPLANSGDFAVSGRGRVTLSDDLDNSGTISVTTTGNDLAAIQTNAVDTQLTGGGTVRLSTDDDIGGAEFFGTDVVADGGVIDLTFTNVDNTISGTGDFGLGFNFVNAAGGEVLAEDGDALRLTTGRMDNDGVVKAEAGGLIHFESEQQYFFGGLTTVRGAAFVDNEDGTIWAHGGNVWLGDSTVKGGNLLTSNPDGNFGFITIQGGTLDGETSAINANASISTFGESFLIGDIDNDGFFFASNAGELDGGGTFVPTLNAAYVLAGDTILGGGGLMSLQKNPLAEINGLDAFLTTAVKDEIYDGNGDLIDTTGYSLTLEDFNVRGRGTIGTSDADPIFDSSSDLTPETAPMLDLIVSAQGQVSGQDQNDGLVINNVNLTNAGEVSARFGGTLEIVDTVVQNSGSIVSNASYLEIRDDIGFGGAATFQSTGDINVSNGGDLFVSKDIQNDGTILITGNSEAVFEGYVEGSGRIALIDSTASFLSGTDNTIEMDFGDADLVLYDSAFFFAPIEDFETGDEIHLVDIDFFAGPTLNFSEDFSSGYLEIDDGSTVATLQFDRPSTGFGPDPLSHFFLEEGSDFGGTLLTTDYDFI